MLFLPSGIVWADCDPQKEEPKLKLYQNMDVLRFEVNIEKLEEWRDTLLQRQDPVWWANHCQLQYDADTAELNLIQAGINWYYSH